MRTPDEIVARIREIDSFFGWTNEVLVPYLPWEWAREFLTPEGVKEHDGKWAARSQEEAAIKQEMLDYLPLAWEKAEDQRGLSAGRSIEKMCAWLWLLGDEEALAFAEDEGSNYRPYGVSILAYLSRRYDQPIPAAFALTHADGETSK